MDYPELRVLWNDPAHWNRDGSYNCAGDPRLFVPKRNGGGWTLNMAHPRAQLTIWLLLLGIFAFTAVLLAYV